MTAKSINIINSKKTALDCLHNLSNQLASIRLNAEIAEFSTNSAKMHEVKNALKNILGTTQIIEQDINIITTRIRNINA